MREKRELSVEQKWPGDRQVAWLQAFDDPIGDRDCFGPCSFLLKDVVCLFPTIAFVAL